MKKIMATLLSVVSLSLLASGPSYEPYNVEIDPAQRMAKTEALACKLARVVALDSVKGEVDDYGYQDSCTYEDEPEVVSSSCSCSAEKNQFKCEYKATVVCYEEVWYN